MADFANNVEAGDNSCLPVALLGTLEIFGFPLIRTGRSLERGVRRGECGAG
jgi:hypothetical protein